MRCQDNIADETLMSFESGYWGKPDGKNSGVGVKHVFNNWTFGSGYLGSLLLALHDARLVFVVVWRGGGELGDYPDLARWEVDLPGPR